MDFKAHSHRHAGVILNELEFVDQFSELMQVISGISDNDLMDKHSSYGMKDKEKTPKSLSKAINDLLKERFEEKGWQSESGIFQDNMYQGDTWRLDFAKNNIAIFFDDIVSKTSDGYDFIAQVVNVNLETGFTFLDGPVQGRKGEIEFDAGHVEIHERGNKIFISSGVKLIIPSSFMKQIGKE